jgi:hypothetical protein
VLADAVEPHRLGQLDVPTERIGTRRRQAAVRPVALVEHQPQVQRPAVEDETVALDANLAEGRVGGDLVDDPPIRVEQPQLGPDQRR